MSTLQAANSRTRNQSMECFKIVSAILVVFLHVPFPGKTGTVVSLVANNFAVPVFFAITGYFNYGADRVTLRRRLKHLLRLYFLAIAASLACGIITTELSGGSSVAWLRSFWPEPREWVLWITLHQDPRNGQLWYLTAACVCYVVLELYVAFFGGETSDYRPLYYVSYILAVLNLILTCFFGAVGIEVPHQLLMNGFFIGLPMFTLGIFLRQYQERIWQNYHLNARKLLLIIISGQLLLFAEYGVGMMYIPFGKYMKTVGLMLLMIYYPVVTPKDGFPARCISKFGAWSTYIYILHILILQIYDRFFQQTMIAVFTEQSEAWLRPIAVALLSFIAAVLFELGERLFRRLRSRR